MEKSTAIIWKTFILFTIELFSDCGFKNHSFFVKWYQGYDWIWFVHFLKNIECEVQETTLEDEIYILKLWSPGNEWGR